MRRLIVEMEEEVLDCPAGRGAAEAAVVQVGASTEGPGGRLPEPEAAFTFGGVRGLYSLDSAVSIGVPQTLHGTGIYGLPKRPKCGQILDDIGCMECPGSAEALGYDAQLCVQP